MGRPRGPAWLLLGALALLRGGCPGASSSSRHSARYFLTALSEPSQGLPLFTIVAYVDGQLIGYYDSRPHRILSPVPWVQKIEKEDPRLWDMHTQRAQNEELYLSWHLADMLKLHNQSGVPPEVTVTRKDSHEGLETLLCRAHGFYPREIDATWRRDGEVRQGDTFRGVLSPNADGTYFTWLSIEVDPRERSRFRCHVEHDGLQEPLDVAVGESGTGWLIALGVVSGVLLLLAVAGAFLCLKKRREGQPY